MSQGKKFMSCIEAAALLLASLKPMLIANALIIGGPKRYAKMFLDTSGTANEYTTLVAELYVNDMLSTRYRFKITEPRFRPDGVENQVSEGLRDRLDPTKRHGSIGHWWDNDGCFYGYTPDEKKITAAVREMLKFHQVKIS